MTSTDGSQALQRLEVRYQDESGVDPVGRGFSTETTIWQDILQEPLTSSLALDEPCRLAALCYADVLRSMSLGLLGARASQDSTRRAPTLAVRPIRLALLDMGDLVHEGPGHWAFPVRKGLLVARHLSPEDQAPGWLSFRWWREGRDEIFQTRVLEYAPMLIGARNSPLRRAFYRLTQANAHRFVMWRYHKWVQRERSRLIEELDPFAR